MISLTKVLIGAGALGTAGLTAWGAYRISLPKTIQDKLVREGLKILNLDKKSELDKDDWKQKVDAHKAGNETTVENLKISGLDLSSDANKEAENIEKFKNECGKLLRTVLGSEGANLKEQQSRKWCVKEIPKATSD